MLGGAQAWLRYRNNAFGDPLVLWESGPDFVEFEARWAVDAMHVEAMLTYGLAARDPLAAEALMRLPLAHHSAVHFTRVLTACLDTQLIGFHLKAVEALHVLTGDESWSREVVRVMLGAGFWADRREAASVLGDFQATSELISAAARAVEDPEYLVRHQAANTLLRFSGRGVDIADFALLHAHLRTGTVYVDWAVVGTQLADQATSYAHSH